MAFISFKGVEAAGESGSFKENEIVAKKNRLNGSPEINKTEAPRTLRRAFSSASPSLSFQDSELTRRRLRHRQFGVNERRFQREICRTIAVFRPFERRAVHTTSMMCVVNP